MNDPDDRDLAAAFDGLHAPRSTARYRDRARELPPPSRSRWPQVAAGVLAVVVAAGAAVTVLGLRNARQASVATAPGASGPQARTGAAMAFDSTSGRTVLYGGVGADGVPLSDTWEWDGTAWHRLTGSPGPVLGMARLADDPRDGGVLLVGARATPGAGSSGGGCAVSGSAGTNGSATPPPVAPTPPTTCSAPAAVAPPAVETWTLGASGWVQRVAGSTTAETPSATAQLALDPASGDVIAVQPGLVVVCGTVAPTEAEVPCPLAAGSASNSTSAGGSAAAPAISCPEGSSCLGTCPVLQGGAAVRGSCAGAGVNTFRWSGDRWTRVSNAGPAGQLTSGLLVPSTANHELLLLTSGTPILPTCAVRPPCGTATSPSTTWRWTGSAWSSVATSGTAPATVPGAAAASTSAGVVVLTASGDTFSLVGGTWTVRSASGGPGGRFGEALAEGPGGQVVLFGGTLAGSGVASASTTPSDGSVPPLVSGIQPGADTWTLTSTGWTKVGGAPPPSAGPVPPVCPSPAAEPAACVAPVTAPANLITPSATQAGGATPSYRPVPTAP